MEKIGAKSIMLVLLPVFLLQLSSRVGAVDIIFYQDYNQCTGSGYSFNGIANLVCCDTNGGSVLVTSTDGTQLSYFFNGGGCSNQVNSGKGNFCALGGPNGPPYTGAFWNSNGRRRSLLGDSSKCTGQMKPSGVVFTDNRTNGTWILTSSEATELFSQMQNVPDAKKASWLQSQGATYAEL